MKKKIRNCLATTGLALILLAMVAMIYRGRFLCIETVFQVLGVSVLIHIGLMLLEKFESRYFFVEILAEVGMELLILIAAGFAFHWYESVPVWVLLLMGIAVYVIGCMIDMFRIKSDINVINDCLQQNHSVQGKGQSLDADNSPES